MLKQIVDFQAEAAELGQILEPLSASDWHRVTQFKGYTINDVLRHLHQGDHMALAAAEGAEVFEALREVRRVRRQGGVSARDDARLEFGHLADRALLDAWRTTLAALCQKLAALPADARLKWAGPDMGVRMFTTARQMEVWSHGHEIADLLGIDRAPTDRLENIAVIGVRTFGWTFVNRGLSVPGEPPRVRLTAPSGAIWEWHAGSQSGSVTGTALHFAQVVTQVRSLADTQLVVNGDVAQRWMAIAQCFAGPPEDPPKAGSRFRVA